MRLVVWLAIRRLRVSPGIILASSLGVLLAVTMVAATVIHSNTIAQAGLSYALGRTISQDALNFHIRVPERPLGEADYERLNTSVSGSVESHLGWIQESRHRLGRSPVFSSTAGPEGSGPTLVGADGYIYFQEGFQEHARLVDGRWPQEAVSEDADGNVLVEAVVGLDIASRGLRLGTGSKAFLAPLGPRAEDRVIVEVVGVAAPADPEHPYWFGDLSRFRVETDGVSVFVPFYVSEQAFFEGAGRRYPMLLGSYSWYVDLALETLRPESVGRIERAREALESELNRAFPRTLALSALAGSSRTTSETWRLPECPCSSSPHWWREWSCTTWCWWSTSCPRAGRLRSACCGAGAPAGSRSARCWGWRRGCWWRSQAPWAARFWDGP